MKTFGINVLYNEIFYDAIHVKVEESINIPSNSNVHELVLGLVVKRQFPKEKFNNLKREKKKLYR